MAAPSVTSQSGRTGRLWLPIRSGNGGRGTIGVNVDPDGLGPTPMGRRVVAATTAVGLFELIPAQPIRGVDAEAALAVDTSAGATRGRIYLAYTDESIRPLFNTDVYLRYSDDQGLTWSAPARVNDDEGVNSQFFPRMVLDPADGQLCLTWYDAREDLGSTTDPLDVGNLEVALFGARGVSTADGVTLSANVQISEGVSDVNNSDSDIDLGDYLGLTIADGIAHPAWADNSNSTGDNPNGSNDRLDVYTASVPLASLPAATRVFAGGLAFQCAPSTPVAKVLTKGGPLVVRNAEPLRFTLQVSDVDGVNPTSLATAIRVTGPGGFDTVATLIKQSS